MVADILFIGLYGWDSELADIAGEDASGEESHPNNLAPFIWPEKQALRGDRRAILFNEEVAPIVPGEMK
jgi:hypothetical protein